MGDNYRLTKSWEKFKSSDKYKELRAVVLADPSKLDDAFWGAFNIGWGYNDVTRTPEPAKGVLARITAFLSGR